MNIIERIVAYKDGMKIIREWIGQGSEVVPQEEAQRRADICIQCPKNVGGWMIIDRVADAIRRQTELKNHLNLRVDNEDKVKTCSACGCNSRLKLWIPLKNIEPEESERAKFDPKCWLLEKGTK